MHKYKILQPVQSMKWNDHLLYWGYLFLLSLLLMAFYFYGSPWMQELAAPTYNREFGLVENVQIVILLVTAYMAYRLLVRSKPGWIRTGYLLILLTLVFTFFEEIDYGYHYINYLNDADLAERTINHNIHNTPNVNNYIRLVFYIVLLVFVILLPYFPSIKLPGFIQHFVPTIRLQLTLVTFLIVSRLVGIFNNLSTSTNMALNVLLGVRKSPSY